MGENNKAAMLNIKVLTLDSTKRLNSVYPTVFTVPKSHGYRKQSIIVEIYSI